MRFVGEGNDEAQERQEDIQVEGDTISVREATPKNPRACVIAHKIATQPTKPPVALGSSSTLDHSSALVDTVTDKIRGESMSLPADNAPHNSDPAHLEVRPFRSQL